MCGRRALGGVLIVLGIVIMACTVPAGAWGAAVGIVFVTTGAVFAKR